MNDEEMLTRGLQKLASEMEALEAPATVEAKVLEAFRAHRKVVPIRRRPSNTLYWLAAVAAMLLIAISVVVLRWNAGTVETPQQAMKQEEPQNKPKVDDQQTPAPQQLAVAAGDQTSNPLPQRRKLRRIHAAAYRPDNAQVANHVTNEVATDFIPIGYMSAANLQDGGQIVRVQLPRSALANFGLPVNMDRYNEKVKADILLGVDGRAHAIRFVQ
jgi:hypothetical protein